jgi:hypothetical protein
LQFADWLTNKIFVDLQFADQSKEICGLAYLRNLWICDCGLSPRICGFKKNSCLMLGHICKFTQGLMGELIHEKT